MSSDALHFHRRRKGPPIDKREPLEEQGVASKSEQGQKRWQTLGLREHRAWAEVLPLWQELDWYKYTGAQKGGALFARWPDSEQWGAEVWTANVPNAIKELALRHGLAVTLSSQDAGEPDLSQPGLSQPGQLQPGRSQPGPSQPGQSQPDQSQSGQSQSRHSEAGQSQPGQAHRDRSLPGQSQPQQSEPDFDAEVHQEPPASAATPSPPAICSSRPRPTSTDSRDFARKLAPAVSTRQSKALQYPTTAELHAGAAAAQESRPRTGPTAPGPAQAQAPASSQRATTQPGHDAVTYDPASISAPLTSAAAVSPDETLPTATRPRTATVDEAGTPAICQPSCGHVDAGALTQSTAGLLMALANGDALPSPVNKDLDSEAQVGYPRLLDRIREAADEYVQHEVHQCDMAVDRWRSECMNAHRKLKATESVLLAMEQRHQGELQTMLKQQEQSMLQQQADHVCKDRERIRELEIELASSTQDQAQLASSQQTVEELQKQVTELQQHNNYLQQETDEQEALIQSWSRAAESRAKRLRTSDAAR